MPVVVLMLLHRAVARASIDEPLVLQRFWVFWPSVRRMITLSRSDAGADPSGNGMLGVSACQPHTRPTVMLVLPAAVMPSILVLSASQLVLSGIAWTSEPHVAAGYQV